ncbi:hypothetical protein Tco_1313811 [Tanacetum coccineum]
MSASHYSDTPVTTMGNVSVPELSSLGGRIPRAGVAVDSGAIATFVDNVGAHTASSLGRIVMDNVGAHTASSSNGIATIMDNVGADVIIVPYFGNRTPHADIIGVSSRYVHLETVTKRVNIVVPVSGLHVKSS